MYMKRNYLNEIETLIDSIKGIITSHHIAVNNISVSSLEQMASFKDYVPDVKAIKTQNVKENARQSARDLAIKATQRLELAYDDLRTTVYDWLSEPLPTNFADIIRVHDAMNLKLSLAELRSLTRLAAGNYYGMKIISEIAGRDYFTDIPFTDADSIVRQIDGSEGDCKTAVNAYAGVETVWLNDIDPFYQDFAATFLDRNQSQLITMEKTLRDALDEESPLIVSEGEKIAKLFENAKTESDKLSIMCNAILNSVVSETRLQAYDSNLYRQAKEALAKESAEAARQARKAKEKAIEDSKQASIKNARVQADVAKLNNNAANRR